MIKDRIAYLIGDEYADDFAVNFLSDAVICTMERWLLEKDCLTPDQFTAKLKRFVQSCADALHKEMNLAG